jgi:hypothetical protein
MEVETCWQVVGKRGWAKMEGEQREGARERDILFRLPQAWGDLLMGA